MAPILKLWSNHASIFGYTLRIGCRKMCYCFGGLAYWSFGETNNTPTNQTSSKCV